MNTQINKAEPQAKAAHTEAIRLLRDWTKRNNHRWAFAALRRLTKGGAQ